MEDGFGGTKGVAVIESDMSERRGCWPDMIMVPEQDEREQKEVVLGVFAPPV
jgi:hypothetical protein